MLIHLLRLCAPALLPALLLLASQAQALTLGETRVFSYLGQPLHLQVELTGANQAQVSSMQARVGSFNDFERLSMSYDAMLANQLSIEPRLQTNGWVLEIRSRKPFDQPFVEFPLEVRGSGNRLIKGITVLLDPPNYRPPSLPTRTAPAQTAPSAPKPSARQPAPQSARVTAPATGGSYRVKPGDYLSRIARRLRPAGVSTRQMTQMLFEANPQAFSNGNINLLKAGAVLQLPAGAQADSAGGKQTSAPAPKPPAPATPAPVQPEQAEPESSLRVLEPDNAEQGNEQEQLRRQVLLTHEEVELSRLKQQQLREEIANMRQEMEHLHRLLVLKNEQIAALQALSQARRKQEQAEQALNSGRAPAASKADRKQAAVKAAESAPQAAMQSAPEPGEIAATADPQPADTAADASSTDPTATDDATGAAPASAAAPAPIQVAPPVPVPDSQATTRQPGPAGIDWRTWWWTPILVLVLLVLLILTWLLGRRSRGGSDAPLSELPSIVNAPPRPYTRGEEALAALDQVPMAAAPRHAAHTEVEAGAHLPGNDTPPPADLPPESVRQMPMGRPATTAEDTDEPYSSLYDPPDSLIDEPLSQLMSGDAVTDDADGPPGASLADLWEDEAVSDEDLQDLATQLSDEDTEYLLSPVRAGDAELEEPARTGPADDAPAPTNADRASRDDLLDELPDGLSDGSEEEPTTGEGLEDLTLELARAWIELGDVDGALEMLRDALKNADEDQRAEIEALIKEAGG